VPDWLTWSVVGAFAAGYTVGMALTFWVVHIGLTWTEQRRRSAR
jgi:hypothetical protein